MKEDICNYCEHLREQHWENLRGCSLCFCYGYEPSKRLTPKPLMKKERRKCSVCQHWFTSEGGLVSCPAHSFGETDPTPTTPQSWSEEYCRRFGACNESGKKEDCAEVLAFITETVERAVREERARIGMWAIQNAVYDKTHGEIITRVKIVDFINSLTSTKE